MAGSTTSYRNRNRIGVRSSATIVPKSVLEDIDERIRVLSPEATPLQTLSGRIGRGKPPTSHKVQVTQYHEFDNYDYCSSFTLGTTDGPRYASLTLDQASRAEVGDSMYYYPQDKFYIVATGQTVEVVMNDSATQSVNGSDLMLDTGLTGNTTTRSAAGTVIVRNVVPAAIKSFTVSDVIYLGRTIYESQDIEAQPAERDCVYDCNFVEHKEKVINMTEDQKNLVKTRGSVPDWTFQQRQMVKEFKKDVEYTAFFGERQVDFSDRRYPKRHMRGFLSAVRTNLAAYNPSTVTDFESMYSNFLYEQAFRYNPVGTNKIALCGARFLYNFNVAFKEYRRTTSLKINDKIVLDAQQYVVPGGFSVTLIRSEILRQNTPLEDWCFILDPALAEWKIKKDYNTKMYNLANERKLKLMIEWQGTIAWNLEHAHAVLRTYQ